MTSQSSAFDPPNWLRHWKDWHENGDAWGFVIFRTALYGENEERHQWDEFKARFETVVRIPFKCEGLNDDDDDDDFNAAVGKFKIHWIEDPELANATADTLRARYRALLQSEQWQAPGDVLLNRNVFFCASPEAVQSLLSVENPAGGSERWSADAPFLLAVAAEDDSGVEPLEDEEEEGPHEEREWFKPVFKVAIESMVDELWLIIDSDMMPLRRMTRLSKAAGELGGVDGEGREGLEEIWWTMAPSPRRLRKRYELCGRTASLC